MAVLPINPGRSLADHLGVHVHRAGIDPSDRAAVSVCVLHHNADGLAEGQVGKDLPRAVAVGLSGLWRIDLGKANSRLPLPAIEDGQGVTIRDAHDAASDLGRYGR